MATTGDLLSISEVSRAFGIPVSALRYYDDIGLVPAPHRVGRVRHYDRSALRRLIYARLWLVGGGLGVCQAADVVSGEDHIERNRMLAGIRADIADRIRRLREAEEMLQHLARCHEDRWDECPVIGGYLDQRVGELLDGEAPNEETGRPEPMTWARFKAGALNRLADLAPPV